MCPASRPDSFRKEAIEIGFRLESLKDLGFWDRRNGPPDRGSRHGRALYRLGPCLVKFVFITQAEAIGCQDM